MEKVIITAALTGAATRKEQNPTVPYTPQEFAEESYKCWKAGASIVHIHVRDPQTGFPTAEIPKIRDTINAIKDKCPELIINMSSAIGPGVTAEQRIAPIVEMKPDLASLNTNSMNFGLVDYKTGKVFLEIIFENTFKMLVDFAKAMRENGVKPECEVYDFGGIYNVLLVRKQGIFEEPMHFQLVFGVAGGVPFTPMNMVHMQSLLPEGATWSVCGVGPNQFPAGIMASIMGGHIRVGLEDNIRALRGKMAEGSWEQVEVVKRIVELADREVATPAEARKILKLKMK
ncbi:MAG: 3-keto-5-aminohexanoate cleavage protein [Thermodesulfobacteriota bacterium]|nr:3-keto-5-aminohexanoate cleavage protein [Thermodesulfobacteriota bacterium]